MALAYVNRSVKDFGGGIDQRSTPDSVPETFSEDLQNVITNSNGFLAKRPGYQGYYGYLPLRVKSISHSGTDIKFILDDSIDVSSIENCPIVVQGKLSGSQSGDWTNSDNVEYYTTASSDVRTDLTTSGSPVTVSESTHGVASSSVFITLMDNSANTSTKDWSLFFADRVDVADSSTFDIDIEYSTLPSDITAFVGVSDKTTTSGDDYTTADLNLIDTQTCTFTAGGTDTVNITSHGLSANDPVQFTTTGSLPTLASGTFSASTTYYVINSNANDFQISTTVGGAALDFTDTGSGTHTCLAGDIIVTSTDTSFTNNNILVQVLEKDTGASEYYRIFPDVSINNSTGTVTITHSNSGSAPLTVKAMLSQAPAANFTTAQVGVGAPGGTDVTTTITGATSDWYDVQVYQNVSGTLTQVIPEDVTKDESANTLDVQILNAGSSTGYVIVYEAIDLSSSTLVVTDNGAVSATYTDNAPQLTLWGIDHNSLYSTSGNQEGHVTHIDAYKKDTEERMVAGLGGNLYTAKTRAEEGTDFKIPTTDVNITGSMAADTDLAPCFDVTGSTVNRTRGLVTSDEVSSNKALISSVAFVSDGVAKYTLTLTNKSGDLSTAIDTPDKLTVTGMAHDVHNGTFTITAVDNSENTITVSNSNLKLDDFDETGAEGRAAIYTDQVTLTANSEYLPDDTFVTNIASTEPTVSTSSGTTVVLSGITSALTLANNLSVYGSRSGSVIPVDSTDDFVKGDMCTFGSLDRQVRVVGINTASDLTISSITGDGTTATVTTSTAHGLSAGQSIVLLRTGVAAYDGEQAIAAVTTGTTFTFTSTTTTTASTGVVLGKTISIDESTTITDGTTATALSVVGRWIPAEAPTTSDGLPATTYIKHLNAKEYEQQDTIRSTMVSDNMYFTNFQDEIMKFDGTNIYQAGIFRWQPQLFSELDTTTTSIPLDATVGNVSAVSANKFTVGSGEAAQFAVGDTIIHDNDSAIYIVQSVDTTNNLVYTTSTISGAASGDIKLAVRFKYYFRLNAIDANNTIVASAATGAEDFVFDLKAAGQIKMRLLGFPVWGNYDYDKLELEVYRTKTGSASPFYRVTVKDISFNIGDGYIDFTDGVTDDTLGTKDLDPINTSLKGAELGTAWSQPLRAKYVTSADNRLILANVKDYPELDIVIRSDEGVGTVTAANMSGKILTLRKDDTDTGTTTDMEDVARYEFVTSGEVTITPNTDIAQTSSTFTVTKTSHGLSAGDWVYMFHSAAGTVNTLTYAGWWQINSTTSNTFVVKANMNTAATANDVDRYVAATTTTDIPVWIGTDGNMNQIDANTITEFTAMIRMANAINASMRMADTSLSSPDQTNFTPWVTANAGSEYNAGQLVLRQEKVESTTMECVLPAAITGASYFVGGLAQSAAAEVSATTRLFTSRVVISYQNFPEVFDNPFGDPTDSDSVIDVNSADGQDITGIIPFFGDAVFGTGQVEDIIVVFKTNSIYLLNITNREISKIQSRGLGCTAPFSIASTRDGIMFANNSGIYRLGRDQSIDYVGKNMERLYRDNVNRDELSKMSGHHYSIAGQYKLSVPFGTSQTTNNRVFVYDHQRERPGEFGSWTQFTNHNATGWANLGNDAFFATTDGQVFSIRRLGDSTDYRDDAAAVDEMIVILRADDFGAAGARKVINSVVSHFHVRYSSMTGTEMLSSVDLDGDFESAGTFTFTKAGNDKVKTARSALPKRKVVYIQLKYANSTKDEDVILSGVDYRIALLTDKGVVERSETS
jgi:hypothetical protein